MDGGGKSKRDIAADWREKATPTYPETSRKVPEGKARTDWRVALGHAGDLVPGRTTIARWVSKMDKSALRVGVGASRASQIQIA